MIPRPGQIRWKNGRGWFPGPGAAWLALAAWLASGPGGRMLGEDSGATTGGTNAPVVTLEQWEAGFVTLSVAGWGANLAVGEVATGGSLYDFGQVLNAPELRLPNEGSAPITGLPSVPSTNRLDAAAGFNVVADETVAHTVGVACGEFHTLLLRRDGTVAARGWNPVGQASVPPGLDRVVQIACGADHNLVVRADGSVVAWGWNRDGQCTVPANLGPAASVAGGGFHSLALLRDGTVRAWGRRSDGQCDVPPGLGGVTGIAAGARHSLALRGDGRVVAWGDNSQGQCEVPDTLRDAVEVSAGAFFSLARTAGGQVVVWGDLAQGEMLPPAGLDQVVQVAAGEFHALALRANGTVVAWGDNTYRPASVPTGLTNVVAVAAGGYHSQALVQTLPPLSRPRMERGRFVVDLNLPAGRRYEWEASHDLNTWRHLGSGTVIPGEMTLTPPEDDPGNGSSFFRARLTR